MESVNIQCFNGQIDLNLLDFHKFSRLFREFINSYPQTKSFKVFFPYSTEFMQRVIQFKKSEHTYIRTIQEAMDLYRFGKHYGAADFVSICHTNILSNINFINVFVIYEFAWKMNDFDIMYECWKWFDHKGSQIFGRPEYLQCSEITINTLLSRPIYEKLNESILFNIVCIWAKIKVIPQTNLRRVIEPFLSKIRFLSMGKKCFERDIFNVANVLTDEEIEAIRNYFSSELKDKSKIPANLCTDEYQRDYRFYYTLFHYNHRVLRRFSECFEVNARMKFNCEISVKENCFIYRIRLPVIHSKKTCIKIYVDVKVVGGNREFTRYVECDREGQGVLNSVIFLRKNSVSRLNAKIDRKDLIPENQLRIKPDNFYFFQEHKSPTAKEEEDELRPSYYFEVDLYF
ncbi:uncharacterized protein LOC111614794 [Centruroides sculpturatus]|uniref:uncharacterized protein LOC111614794 n=1 Tax=Centruroides sculpturatus TaxID=218467 RepID=UPI000C6CD00B|nr:uncharacterized protein LOC111614794 [Centruroides sculpturatus]